MKYRFFQLALPILLSNFATSSHGFSLEQLESIPKHTKKSYKMTANNEEKYLTPITADQVKLEIKDPVDPTALVQAKDIVKELTDDGKYAGGGINPSSLMTVAKKLGDIPKEDSYNSYIVTKDECKAAFENLDERERKSLENIHARVKTFADAQRKSVTDMEIDIPGGKAGHTVSPCSGEWLEMK